MPRSKERRKPLISDAIAMTVATPMTMPRSASRVRSRFAASAWRAIRNVSRRSAANPMPSAYRVSRDHRPGPRRARPGSLVAEGVHGVQARGAHRRVEPEEDADHRGDEQPHGDGPPGDEGRQRQDRPHEPRHTGAEQDA